VGARLFTAFGPNHAAKSSPTAATGLAELTQNLNPLTKIWDLDAKMKAHEAYLLNMIKTGQMSKEQARAEWMKYGWEIAFTGTVATAESLLIYEGAAKAGFTAVEAAEGWAARKAANPATIEAIESAARADYLYNRYLAERAAAEGAVVIGKNPSYTALGEMLGTKTFNVPPAVWEAMGDDAVRWAANQRFLDRAIARGDEFILSSPVEAMLAPARDGGKSWSTKELEYLFEKGYRLNNSATRMIKVGG
jgi:hypothetical protein